MSDSSIYDAFALKVDTFAAQFSPPLPVSYPGVGFDPPASGSWLEVQWFPNKPENYGLANDGPTLLQGFAQLSVCQRPGGGIVSGLELVDLVIEAFPKGTVLHGGIKIYERPGVSQVIQDPARLAYPVTMRWRGFDG